MRLLIALAAAASIGASDPPPSTAATPVAIELFTSQGCSSCPPADALLAQMARQPNIIVISRPVTYWDRLGWKDSFGRESNTALQRRYAARGGEGAGVYTPQAMVQGGSAVVGSDRAGLSRLVAAEKASPGPSISAIRSEDGGRSVTIGGAARQSATVSIVALKSEGVVRIGSGENGGRTVRYTNVALDDTVVGRWSGGISSLNISGSIFKTRGADRYAILLRDGDAGRIIAARFI
jgi:hypothetical protein